MDLLATFQKLEHLGVAIGSGATYARPRKLTNEAVTGTGELLGRTVQESSASWALMLVLAAKTMFLCWKELTTSVSKPDRDDYEEGLRDRKKRRREQPFNDIAVLSRCA